MSVREECLRSPLFLLWMEAGDAVCRKRQKPGILQAIPIEATLVTWTWEKGPIELRVEVFASKQTCNRIEL